MFKFEPLVRGFRSDAADKVVAENKGAVKRPGLVADTFVCSDSVLRVPSSPSLRRMRLPRSLPVLLLVMMVWWSCRLG